jgi:hypothetical protein
MRTPPSQRRTAWSQMTKASPTTASSHEAAIYEIRLKGHLDARWASQLAVTGLANQGDGTTVLQLAVVDQSGLHGLLQRIRDLGLPLISVTRIDPAAPADEPSHSNPRT